MSIDKRAVFAYDCVKQVYDEKLEPEQYKAYCKKLPMLIKTNGLGATLAFVRGKANGSGKGSKAYKKLESQFLDWLATKSHLSETIQKHSGNLDGRVVKLESPEYRAVTIELLALLNWMRRFAEGLIEGEED